MAKKPSAQKPATKKKRTTTPKSKTTAAKRTAAAQKRSSPVQSAAAPVLPRRAIFVDVENTSSEADLLKVLDHLNVDRAAQRTELFALGNWKSVGSRVARMLASLGAQLMHSAPAVGVRDWSDLWIAVAAGRWLATAVPGDIVDIVSDDRAFDAVGDAAAAAGVVFRRTSYRTVPSAAAAPPAAEPRPHRRRRGGRGRRPLLPRPSTTHEPQPALTATPEPPVAPATAPLRRRSPRRIARADQCDTRPPGRRNVPLDQLGCADHCIEGRGLHPAARFAAARDTSAPDEGRRGVGERDGAIGQWRCRTARGVPYLCE